MQLLHTYTPIGTYSGPSLILMAWDQSLFRLVNHLYWVQCKKMVQMNMLSIECTTSRNWLSIECTASRNWLSIECTVSRNWLSIECTASRNWLSIECTASGTDSLLNAQQWRSVLENYGKYDNETVKQKEMKKTLLAQYFLYQNVSCTKWWFSWEIVNH